MKRNNILFFADCSDHNINHEKNIEEHSIAKSLLNLLEYGKKTNEVLINESRNLPIYTGCQSILDGIRRILHEDKKRYFFVIYTDKSENCCYSDEVIEKFHQKKPKDPVIRVNHYSTECTYAPDKFIIDIPFTYFLDESYHIKLSEIIDFLLNPPNIYISCGNRGEENIDNYINKIKESFQNTFPHIHIIHDKETINHGDNIDNFIDQLTQADYLIILMNNRFFESNDCMNELYGFIKNSKRTNIFMKRLHTILMDESTDYLYNTDKIRKYWAEKLFELSNSIKNTDGNFTVQKLKELKSIAHIFDTNMEIIEEKISRTRHEQQVKLSEENFFPLIKNINNRINQEQGLHTFYHPTGNSSAEEKIKQALSPYPNKIEIPLPDY